MEGRCIEIAMRCIVGSAFLAALILVGLPEPSAATDVVLGGGTVDKIGVQINKKSSSPASHAIKFAAKSPTIFFAPGSVDDPITNGAVALVFSTTDCQCIVLGQAPGTTPGWTASRALITSATVAPSTDTSEAPAVRVRRVVGIRMDTLMESHLV